MTDYFGEVKWNEDDLRDAFETMGYEATDEKVALLKSFCQTRQFEERMIEYGLDMIYQKITEMEE